MMKIKRRDGPRNISFYFFFSWVGRRRREWARFEPCHSTARPGYSALLSHLHAASLSTSFRRVIITGVRPRPLTHVAARARQLLRKGEDHYATTPLIPVRIRRLKKRCSRKQWCLGGFPPPPFSFDRWVGDQCAVRKPSPRVRLAAKGGKKMSSPASIEVSRNGPDERHCNDGTKTPARLRLARHASAGRALSRIQRWGPTLREYLECV
ncbi:hypothetical protein LY76DRAFT_660753 [Colletotrichum caudatum]|nr:hypothetical protein LY76DRAFT_660753 [Colletotrichum caudatum]